MQMAARFAADVQSDLHAWRRVVIALRSAAQSAMVLSLRHGNGLLALTDKCFAEWMEAYEKNETPPPERLDSYLNLYGKVKHRKTGQIGGNTRFVPRGAEGTDIKRLNSLRNDFIHCTPKRWSLEVLGLPRICLSAARLISFLALETTNVRWHSEEPRQALEAAHAYFVASMRALDWEYSRSAG